MEQRLLLRLFLVEQRIVVEQRLVFGFFFLEQRFQRIEQRVVVRGRHVDQRRRLDFERGIRAFEAAGDGAEIQSSENSNGFDEYGAQSGGSGGAYDGGASNGYQEGASNGYEPPNEGGSNGGGGSGGGYEGGSSGGYEGGSSGGYDGGSGGWSTSN